VIEAPDAAAAEQTRARSSRWAKALAVVIAVALLYAVGRQAGASVARFAAWVESLGAWGPAAFIAGYVVAAVAFVPGSVLTLAAGAIFGLFEGTLYVFVGATLGACAAFLVSRYVARAFVEERMQGNERFAAVDRAVGREGAKIVFLLRLSPVFPYNVLNYALGLTDVRFFHFLIGCVGMVPATALYVYYGKIAGDVATAAAGGAPQRGVAGYALLGVGLVATLAATVVITRAARRVLDERVARGAAHA
jgi:uncharacterized membrane protein YdjX (TVP38/TMEM64 family)